MNFFLILIAGILACLFAWSYEVGQNRKQLEIAECLDRGYSVEICSRVPDYGEIVEVQP